MPSRLAELQSGHPPVNGDRESHGQRDSIVSVSASDSIPSHPLGLKPLGNQYLSSRPNARRNIGTWARLPDEMLMLILEHLGDIALLRLASTCKFFYALCDSEELWKALFLLYVCPPPRHWFDAVP